MSDDWVSNADWLARMFVNGSVRNPKTGKLEPRSGAWSKVFRGHPLVQRSEEEAWGRDLRQHVIAQARRLAMKGKQLTEYDAEFFMPRDQKWIDAVSREGLAYLKAKEWRDAKWAEREARAAKDDTQDRKGWSAVGEAVTRAAEAGFPSGGEE